MEPDVLRLDHLYVSVRDLGVSERFYDPVMRALGFKKGTRAIAGEPHVHYLGRTVQYTIRPARSGTNADPYRTGSLHHLCFQVRDAAAVDEAHRRLRALGIEASEPKLYPEYRVDYYATFFTDPDGIRLEIVSDTAGRRLIRERWHELTDFEDPVQRLVERDAAAQAAGHAEPAAQLVRGNLFAADAPPDGERFDALARLRHTTIERIVSSARPGLDMYDQAQDEWVLLVRGTATLEVAGRSIELVAGDYVELLARTPHRVLATSAGALWLAVHVGGEAQSP
jgi:catechol 2,3-dioxygenase-like lactoylglutathione lyase family enzyme/mannose-6-phosphate isomerase-like protein (cupin superfamily)